MKKSFENRRDPSGMFSKAGRVSFEKYPIFHKRREILDPEEEKKKVIPYMNIVSKLVGWQADRPSKRTTTTRSKMWRSSAR